MSYTRILIFLSLVSLFSKTVVGQCQPLEKHKPINIVQCHKAFAAYKFDNNGLLDSDDYKNKKTCGNCAVSMTVVSNDQNAKLSLDGYRKKDLKNIFTGLLTSCTIKDKKGDTTLPAIVAVPVTGANGLFFSIEIEAGDSKENECSSTRRKPRRES